MPLTVSSFLELVGIFILLSWGIYIAYRAGQIYLGHIYTMAIGAYFSAYVVRDLGWPFSLALIVAVGVGALAAFVPALGLSRAPSIAVVIGSIALIFITQTVIRNLEFLGGVHGFFHIPRQGYLLPLLYVVLVIVGFFIYRLEHSRFGRAMEIVFVNPDVAASLGVDIYKLRVFLQVTAGAMGALGGVFYAFAMGTIQAPYFGFPILLALLCFLFVGGSTTMWGVVVFTPILWGVCVLLPTAVSVWKDIIYGSLLIIILILRPDGIIDKNVIRAIARLTTRHKLKVLK